MKNKGILFVMSAPSGAGKTSICKEVMTSFPNLRQSISYTTRSIRAGEKDGVDYHFVSREEFDRMVSSGEFAEWAEVHGNCYGTAKATLLQASHEGIDVLLDIDYQGAAQLRNSGLDAVYIFILPPDMDELQKRLTGRNTDSDEVIARRMQNAAGEIAQAVHFDYLVINDLLERAVATVRSIMCAEAARTHRVLEVLPEEFGLK
jgi:guanylate kinase